MSDIWAVRLKTLGFKVDFGRLLEYLKQKYRRLKEVRYYEEIATGDENGILRGGGDFVWISGNVWYNNGVTIIIIN